MHEFFAPDADVTVVQPPDPNVAACLKRGDKPPIRGLGDLIERGLTKIGITKQRVAAWVGRDCGCSERQAFFNRLFPLGDIPPQRKDYAVAVTTAPRTQSTLGECVKSIQASGVEPIVFAEPDSPMEGISGSVIVNDRQLGCWHNWLNAARYLLDNTDAKVLVTVQDDTVLHPQSFEFLDGHWPKGNVGCVSLYASSFYQRRWNVMKSGRAVRFEASKQVAQNRANRIGGTIEPYDYPIGLNRIVTRSLWGACALAFPRERLRQIIEHPISRNWLGAMGRNLKAIQRKERRADRRRNPHKIANSDTAIGKVLRALNLSFYCPNPALAQHVAKYSALGHGDNSGRRNCLNCLSHDVTIETAFGERPSVVPAKPTSRKKRATRKSQDMKHLVLIRSAYAKDYPSEDRDLRLKLTDEICAASLGGQTNKQFTVICRVDDSDRRLKDLQRAFLRRRIDVRFVSSGEWNEHIANEIPRRQRKQNAPVLITRMDDDDAIHTKFVQHLQSAAESRRDDSELPMVYTFPNGYRNHDGALHSFHRPPNMFVSILSPTGRADQIVHPFQVSHSNIAEIAPLTTVADYPAWLWVRHHAARSRSKTKLGSIPRVNPSKQFTINWGLLKSLQSGRD